MAQAAEKAPKAQDSSPDAGSLPDIDKFLIKDPEQFALNMARMVEQAGKAASAWAEPRERGEAGDGVSEPVADMVRTFSKVSEYWLAEPSRALEAQTKLFAGFMQVWGNSIQRISGAEAQQAITPERGDKRFQDEDWARNAFFDFLKQAYLVASRWTAELVENAEGLDDQTRKKAGFYVKQVNYALSPSNFVLTNPELFRETIEQKGANLVGGMKMLAEDIAAGKGTLKLRQSDASKFEIGRNVAVSPGKVVGRSDVVEVIQYEPTTEKVLKRPLLICPPWINKFYILDLNQEKSFIRWAVAEGHTVYVMSWVNPDERHRDKGWEAYVREGVQFALDTVERTSGERQVNAIGYCVGGTLLAAALALLAQEGDTRIQSATFFTTQVDFEYGGDLKVFVDEEQISSLERAIADKGYLDGTKMATAFNMLRSGDLIWPYVINNYMRGKQPMPFDLLYWNSDSTRMGAANHAYYLRNCYLDNNLSAGLMKLAGKTLSLSDIKIPIYNLATKEDHIAPAKSVFYGCQYFGGDVEYVMSGSGHIAGVVNPPSLKKYQYWTHGKPVGKFEDWVEGAQENPGSWWPHWDAWIRRQDETQVDARVVGGGQETLGDAPGNYVKVRV